MNKIPYRLVGASLALALIASCGVQDSPNSLKEAWDQPNDPGIFSQTYDFRFDSLPASGQTKRSGWSGDYWPTFRGGLSHRWNMPGDLSQTAGYPLLNRGQLGSIDLRTLSPAEKYDIYSGDYSFRLTQAERERTRVLATIAGNPQFSPGFSIPAWEGLCHGWAPASISYQEPRPVTLRSRDGIEVPFGSADIKALLTFAMHEGVGSRTQFLGRRCEADLGYLKNELRQGRLSQAAFDEQSRSLPCRDVNAGSFHVLLGNEIGKRKEAFVADLTIDREVWNQGIVGYKSSFGNMLSQRSPGAAPETAFEVDVDTEITYINEIASSWSPNGSSGIYATAKYRYRLELNRNREIVGGHWLSEKHPDFIYRQTRAGVSQLLENLPSIYKASTGEDFLSGGSSPAPIEPPARPTVPTRPQPPAPPLPPVPGGSGGSSECAPGDLWCLD